MSLLNKRLGMRGVFIILIAQIDSSSRFWEIAVELGLPSPSNVEEQLNFQQKTHQPLGEELIK